MCDSTIERASWFVQDRRQARKPQRCDACHETIEPRSTYVRMVFSLGRFDLDCVRHCLRCNALWNGLAASSREPVQFDLDCGVTIDDADHDLQWLAFALPRDLEARP
jgi:hypothetical protein